MTPTPPGDDRLDLLRHLADPVRLGVLDRVSQHGPASVSELAARLDVSMPQLSNHLRRLRDAGLVDVDRQGRQATYRLADTQIRPLLQLLADLVRASPGPSAPPPGFVRARTCYSHLAGQLGVSLLDRLVDLRAIRLDGERAEPGPAADEVLSRLGVAMDQLPPTRRQLMIACPDATEGRPHLGGALGTALERALATRRWIRRHPDRREVVVTPAGRRGLRTTLQLDLDPVGL